MLGYSKQYTFGMVKMTTIKVPVALRDRIAELAQARHETMAQAVEHALDAADEEMFWAKARATMGTAPAHAHLQSESERFSATLADALEPEDWSDIL